MLELAARLNRVRTEISQECLRLGRSEPTLIVVTKNHPVELCERLEELGVRDFGENKVQEGLSKQQQFAELRPLATPNWHMIGQLQTNKVKTALEFASVIHSLDRESLLTELAKRSQEREQPLPLFIQVNLTDDENRGGIRPSDLLKFADKVATFENLHLLGLMAVASLDRKPEKDFETVAKLSQALVSAHPAADGLSIGMSNDYLPALGFGATHLRIGTAITGKRAI